MTYTLTVNAGTDGLVAPNGIRYRAGDHFTLDDDSFGRLTPGARALLSAGSGGTSTGSLGGTVSHQVTITSGLTGVVLPNGISYGAGAVVVLSDAEYSRLSANAIATLFSANVTTLT